jgi:hypothetical protein
VEFHKWNVRLCLIVMKLVESKSLRLFRQNFQRQFVGGAHSLISIYRRSITPFAPRVGCGFSIAAFVSLVAPRLWAWSSVVPDGTCPRSPAGPSDESLGYSLPPSGLKDGGNST